MKDVHEIHCYTRAEAIEDGALFEIEPYLVNVLDFNYPIAATEAVYNAYIDWSEEDNQGQITETFDVRLINILAGLKQGIRKNTSDDPSLVFFKLKVIPKNGIAKTYEEVDLKAICAGGDNGEPVITIMLPEED